MNSLIALLVLASPIQDKPVDVPKAELPKTAVCVMCKEGEEKPAAGVLYKGKQYFFCNAGEVKTFKANPASFAADLPRLMPKLDLTSLDGVYWDADRMKGKLVLIDWWATWCKPCIAMFPKVDKLREKFVTRGFEVLSVSIDENRKALDGFVTKRKFANPVLHDSSQTWQRWNVSAIPAMFLVKDGQIVAQWIGKTDEKQLAAEIEKHLPR